jgi:oligopeptide transport system substrate-binding protein
MRKNWKFSLPAWSRLRSLCSLLLVCLPLRALSPTTEKSSASTPMPQEIHLASMAPIFSLNPQHIHSGLEETKILGNLYEGLLRRNPTTFELEGAEATAWEISADRTVYTFHLRPHLVWSDGTPITSRSYVEAWQHLLTPATASPEAEEFFLFRNAKAFYKGTIKDFSQVGIHAIDPLTLRLSLVQPDPVFLHRITAPHFCPIPLHMLKAGEAWNQAASYVSNGAFRLKTWKNPLYIHLIRNEKFRESVDPDAVFFHIVENENTQEKLFLTGKLHMTSTLPIRNLPQYKQKKGSKAYNPLRTVQTHASAYGLVFNTKKVLDARIRKALSLVIDRNALASQLRTLEEEPALRYTPTTQRKDYTPQTPYVASPGPKELAYARTLLQEAGYGPGKKAPLQLSLLYNPREEHQKIAVVLHQTWKKNLDIEVPLDSVEAAVLFSRIRTGDFTLARRIFQMTSADPYLYLQEYAKEMRNPAHWHYPPFLALFQKATFAATEVEQMRFTEEAETMLLDQAVVIPLFFYKAHRLVSAHLKMREEKGPSLHWPMDPAQQDQAQHYILIP